jgi:hypothetical protein
MVSDHTDGTTIELSIAPGLSSGAPTDMLGFGDMVVSRIAHFPKQAVNSAEVLSRLDSLSPGPWGTIKDIQGELTRKAEQDPGNWRSDLVVPVVRVDGKLVPLENPLEAHLKMGGLGFILEVPYLGILATGESYSDIQSDLNEKIEVLVAVYLHGDEAKLAPDAIALKRKLAETFPGL